MPLPQAAMPIASTKKAPSARIRLLILIEQPRMVATIAGILVLMDDRPLGARIDFAGSRSPEGVALGGRYVLLRALDPDRDAAPLYAVSHPPEGDSSVWDYLFDGPFADAAALRRTLLRWAGAEDRVFYAAVPDGGEARGVASYLRIEPAHGCIEIGNIMFGAGLQRTRAATEAVYLLARHAFDELGYRRLEWKCNALNAPSRRAAERFGFSFEGVFAQHMVIKGRNRDTAWYAVTDQRWPALRTAFEAWLAPANFDAAGGQRRSLADVRSDAD